MRSHYILTVLFAVAFTGAQAQIFINTGNSSIDKYKQENPNASVTVSTPTDSAKVKTEVKTPTVKIKQTTETTTPKKVEVKQETAKTAVAAKPLVPVKTASAPATTLAPATVKPTTPPADMPPNAEVGKCYARCYVADKYETREETVIDKPLSYKTQTIPATYKTLTDTIVIKPASVRYKEVPAIYETTVEDVVVTPATQKWVKSTADAGCLSANPADCQVMCLKEVPAVYKKVTRKTVKTPASREEIPVPAEYKVVTKKVVDQPARQEQIEIPATYKDVMHKELVAKGGYSEWREILCGDKLTTAKITEIQKALKANGYDPGVIDNQFGGQTKAALIKYQQDKGLPVGNLNIETLKSLGVQQ